MATHRDIHWRQAADDVWVATLGGEYAGMTARVPDGFAVLDNRSNPAGIASTVEAAQRLLLTPSDPYARF